MYTIIGIKNFRACLHIFLIFLGQFLYEYIDLFQEEHH